MDSNTRARLLYIGNEPLLNKASSALLRTAGYKVRVTTPFHANEAARESHYSAVVLCATLSTEEMNNVVEAMERSQPGVPIVSIHVGLLGDGPHPSSSAVVDALNGPNALIVAVQSVIKYRQQAS
jgi:DNA-binding NtrC family response regulator